MALDIAAIQAVIVAGLPIRTRWMLGGTPLDFDFSHARRGLRAVAREDIVGDLDEAWADLLVFGLCDFSEGGGASPWITIRESDGSVCGLDVEREPAVFDYNSSLEQFIQTFVLLDQCLSRCEPLLPGVASGVREIDPDSYPSSEWRSLVDYVTDD
jgi:hypothetical protein